MGDQNKDFGVFLQTYIDPTFFGIFVCGPLQSFMVNVCSFADRLNQSLGEFVFGAVRLPLNLHIMLVFFLQFSEVKALSII